MSNLPKTFQYFDVHCHVNFPEYNADREDVIRRATKLGVGMIVVGTDPESSQSAVALAEKYENIWAVVGLHPADSSKNNTNNIFDYDAYKKLALHPKVVGIGECGLDYFHPGDKAGQAEIFKEQIRLADDVKKPLMLHVRSGKDDAYKDVIDILKKCRADGLAINGNVHFFAGGIEYARQFIELGFYLSFTGVVTFAKEFHEVVRGIPLDRIMSETDAPFVSPVPYRGKRNEPAYVVEVAKAIAKIRIGEMEKTEASGKTEEIVLEALVNNAKKLFNVGF